MQSALLVIHVLLCLSLIGLVLIQQGKGADAGAAFGGGASSAVFGASGAGSFLTRLTTGIAIAFFITSLSLAYIAAKKNVDTSIVDQVQAKEAIAAEKAASEVQPADLPSSLEGADQGLIPQEVPADLPKQ